MLLQTAISFGLQYVLCRPHAQNVWPLLDQKALSKGWPAELGKGSTKTNESPKRPSVYLIEFAVHGDCPFVLPYIAVMEVTSMLRHLCRRQRQSKGALCSHSLHARTMDIQEVQSLPNRSRRPAAQLHPQKGGGEHDHHVPIHSQRKNL
jgi:hypothetical protein